MRRIFRLTRVDKPLKVFCITDDEPTYDCYNLYCGYWEVFFNTSFKTKINLFRIWISDDTGLMGFVHHPRYGEFYCMPIIATVIGKYSLFLELDLI